MRLPKMDELPRQCRVCWKLFSVGAYPPGYLRHKGLINPGSRVAVCPSCQVGRIREAIREILLTGRNSTQDRKEIVEHQQDVHLLVTGMPACQRHLDRRRWTYGW